MSDGIDTRDKDGELRITIMASLAQEESRKISERTKWGTRRQMENGVVLGGGHIYGYRIEKGNLIFVPDECEIVKRIFNSYLYERKGSATIARELNEQKIPTLNGKLWGAHTVLKILRNEKCVGDLMQWKFYTESYLSHKRVPNKGDNPDAPIITIRDHHEAIISRDVWDAVQKQLEERGRLTRESRKHSGKYCFSEKYAAENAANPSQ
ncbi:MAG: recombinase family protein [Lachnospiraceae bacterium]|nr:recombinase family protein [Ruminococcus sp.]MCM1276833.1 recombinase family protein [Lachnospiraceae bacterium]